MTDLLATPEGKQAVEAVALGERVFRQLCPGCRKDSGVCANCRRVTAERLQLALPHLRKAIAAELRAEAARKYRNPDPGESPSDATWYLKRAADFVEGA